MELNKLNAWVDESSLMREKKGYEAKSSAMFLNWIIYVTEEGEEGVNEANEANNHENNAEEGRKRLF